MAAARELSVIAVNATVATVSTTKAATGAVKTIALQLLP